MDQGILGIIAQYDELTFRSPLKEGFTWGAIEAAARQNNSASADIEAIQESRITQLNAEYGENNLKLIVPTCNSETIWKLERELTSRLNSFRQSDNLHYMSHASYFLIGYAAGLFYASSPDDLVNDRICEINLCFRDANVKEHALFEAIKELPVQGQSIESFLRALKQKLQSCHGRVTILFLAACPDNAERIRSDKEQRTLEETLQRSTFSESYQLYDVKSCKLRDITTALRKYKPSILHFSGHASRDGLVFENETGGFDVIKTDNLALVMEQGAKNGLRTVVLNACSTAEQSDCIANTVGCVIAMKDAVNDDACIDFMRAFYHSLAEGSGVEAAFEWGLAESRLLYRPDIIRPLLIKGGTKSKQTGEEAQKKLAKHSNTSALWNGKLEVRSAQSTGLVDHPNNDGKTALTEADVDEDESETTEDRGKVNCSNGASLTDIDTDQHELASEIEAPHNAERSSNGSKTISTSPSQATAAAGNPLALENALAFENSQETESTSSTQQLTSKMGEVAISPNTALEGTPPTSENVQATTEVASGIGGTQPRVKTSPYVAKQPGLSMIEQLKLRSQMAKEGNDNGRNEAGLTNDPALAQKPSASSRPIPNAQTPRQSSSQAGNAPRLQDTNPNDRFGAAGRPKLSPFHRHSLFDDPFFKDPFLGGEIFNDMMFNGFLGLPRAAPPQARPTQDRSRDATTSRGGNLRVQFPPCDICENPLTMKGGLTCISCTKGEQIACATCAPKLRCVQEKHEVRLVKFQIG